MSRSVVTGAFDNVRSSDVRLLQEAAMIGPLTILLWPDEGGLAQTGFAPKFPFAERLYFLKALRFVTQVLPMSFADPTNFLPRVEDLRASIWIDAESQENERRRQFCATNGLEYRVISKPQLGGFPQLPAPLATGDRKKVVVTGCFDWLHTGHVRFFEEVSEYGELYVIVGHDANIRLLKGEGHPLFSEQERRYMVGAIRYVSRALVSSGDGWLDADPEIQEIKPDIYAVNEDGDRGGKREYCIKRGIEYLVLKRIPAPGLAKRSSTDLRGF